MTLFAKRCANCAINSDRRSDVPVSIMKSETVVKKLLLVECVVYFPGKVPTYRVLTVDAVKR